MMNFFTSNGIVKESPANELTLSTNNNYHHLQQQLQSREPLTLEFDGLTNTSCYDVLSVSYKVICFDTSLPVKKALAALLSHGVESAPLWDSIKQCFAGMLTVSDFIHLIMYYYKRSSYDAAIEEVEQLEIRTLREIEAKVGVLPPGMYIHPARTLYEAGSLLLKHGVHRIALLDRAGESETMVGIITQFQVLKYIAANYPHSENLFKTIAEIKIGVYQPLITARATTPLIEVLETFVEKRVSAMPIVDEDDNIVDVYEKHDVLMLAREGQYYDLEVPVGEALQGRGSEFEGIHTCTMQDTVGALLETIRTANVHRFLVVDGTKLLGIIALSDLLRIFIPKK
ncbi:hypothetical protein SeLEV6574_g03050 [Synchytrium endobioticum]|uniref:CBS domain-containing protein n=1 Tax=Synchytrium endobioticum TaxID=286115 RepID=A0A507D5P7_9FUNG|nr:hypothetical protein SeLEV6574_g03050 [Synchytrium endobioticum]